MIRARKWIVPLVVSVGVIGIFLSKVPLAAMAASISGLPLWFYLFGFVATALFVALRALRFQVILQQGAWTPLLPAVALYSTACMLLPGGTGELTLSIFLRRRQVATGTAIGAAVLSRVFDVSLSVVLLTALYMVSGEISNAPLVVLLVPALGLVGVAAAVSFPGFRSAVLRLLRGPQWLVKTGAVETIIKAYQTIRTQTLKQVVILFFATLAIKAVMGLFYFVLLKLLRLDISYVSTVKAMMLTSLLLSFPIQGVAGVGSEDAWWALSLHLIGISLKDSIVAAIACHFLNLFFVAGLSVEPAAAYLYRRRMRNA